MLMAICTYAPGRISFAPAGAFAIVTRNESHGLRGGLNSFGPPGLRKTESSKQQAEEQKWERPALSCYVLTVDYREGWVRMEPPQKSSAPWPRLGDNAKLPVPLAFS